MLHTPKKRFGDNVDIKIFKYPELLTAALKCRPPDIIGFANYCWNDALNEFFCEKVKSISKSIITLKGGPQFPLKNLDRVEYLKERPFTDFYIPKEGEASFVDFLEAYFQQGSENLKKDSISGTVFLDKNQEMVSGKENSRIEVLDDIPSPYLNGMFDEFFDGKLSPTIETNRGCPFACNFCNLGYSFYTKMKFFSFERVAAELHYIGSKAQKKEMTFLLLADNNFGMFDSDFKIAKELKRCQQLYNWPLSLMMTTGKNKIEKISKVMGLLKDTISVSLSLQSSDPKVLDEIKRENISQDVYFSLSEDLKKEGKKSQAELICPLPQETFSSYKKGVQYLVNSKVDRVSSHQLILSYGTDYDSQAYLDLFKYKAYYRAVPNCFGIYDGQFIVEPERIGVATSTFSEEDYLNSRLLALWVELAHNHNLFGMISKYGLSLELEPFDLVLACFDNCLKSDGKIKEACLSFLEETKGELFIEKSDLSNFYSNKEHQKKLYAGEIGRNVLYTNYAQFIHNLAEEVINFMVSCLKALMLEKGISISLEELEELTLFNSLKLKGMFSPKAKVVESGKFNFNLVKWYKSPPSLLKDYKFPESKTIYFFFNETQMYEREDNFRRHGADALGNGRIIAKVHQVDKFLRQSEFYTNEQCTS